MAGWLLNTSIREGGVAFFKNTQQSTTYTQQSTTYIWEAKLLTKRSLTKVWELASQNYCNRCGLVIFILFPSPRGGGGGEGEGLLHHNTYTGLGHLF